MERNNRILLGVKRDFGRTCELLLGLMFPLVFSVERLL